ncbi:hypothetical protein [Brevundimonas lenta]|uniref:Lipoprotein n=1 Tax=Brevundimonas lenta TaxID=424796 RepID=A0A7W6NNL2_9CAUL|nr:hypothetical protein [Brevundimonas lenta]MBB4082470.1 hypothetical protein [Brevundimonas lenta]
MRLPILLSLSLLAGVAACATAPEPAPPVATAAGPAPVAGYDWFFHEDENDARLAYGTEATDDLKLGLDCRRGSGRLDLSANAPAGTAPEIHIESGGDTERYRAKSEPSMVNEGVFLSAEARADEPVFQRFRRVGWLALWQGDERQPFAPHPGSAGRIEQFFAFCG